MRPVKLIVTVWSLIFAVVALGEDRFQSSSGPLILTPYLQRGDITTAQELSRVVKDPFQDSVVSYSGYFTTDPEYDSNIFFWFFPAGHDETNSLMIFLNGGPGCSSLFGLFVENGPYIVNETSILCKRPTSWTTTNSVLFVDSPVGTGFSFTRNESGYATEMSQVIDGLYATLCQFFLMFPEYRTKKFFITGESFAGKYIPYIALRILQKNPGAKNDFSSCNVQLNGISIGNGFIDPENSLNYAEFLFDLGLIDIKTRELAEHLQERIKQLIRRQKWKEAFEEYDKFIGYSGLDDYFIARVTGLKFYYNVLVPARPPDYDYYTKFVEQDRIREALHVGNVHFQDGTKVLNLLKGEIMQSAKEAFLSLIKSSVPLLLYSGQLDMIVANRLTDSFINTLYLDGFRNSPRYKWTLGNGEIAGYYKTWGNFTRLTVRNCGHMVPYDNPKFGYALVNSFVRGFFHKNR